MYARRILAHGFDSQRMPKAYDVVRFKPKTAKQWLLENKESEAITRQEEIFLLAPNPRPCPNTDTAFQRKEPKGVLSALQLQAQVFGRRHAGVIASDSYPKED